MFASILKKGFEIQNKVYNSCILELNCLLSLGRQFKSSFIINLN